MLAWLINPFHFIAGARALAIGLAFIVLAALVCVAAGSHFDGIIDAHYGSPAPSFALALLEGLLNFLLMVVVLTPFAYAIGRPGFRFIDLLGTQALARAPFVLVALAMLAGNAVGVDAIGERLQQMDPAAIKLPLADSLLLFGFGLLPLVFVLWSIYLMYRSFAICTHTKTAKTVACFIVALLIAEIASKFAHAMLFRQFLS